MYVRGAWPQRESQNRPRQICGVLQKAGSQKQKLTGVEAALTGGFSVSDSAPRGMGNGLQGKPKAKRPGRVPSFDVPNAMRVSESNFHVQAGLAGPIHLARRLPTASSRSSAIRIASWLTRDGWSK